MKVQYPDKFKVGDVAVSRDCVKFADGTFHRAGERIKVTKETEAYFNVMHEMYDLM